MLAQADCPTFSPGQSRTSVLQAAAMAAKWWEPARDALDTMVLGAADLDALSGLRHVDFTPFDPTLKARTALNHLRCLAAWCWAPRSCKHFLDCTVSFTPICSALHSSLCHQCFGMVLVLRACALLGLHHTDSNAL